MGTSRPVLIKSPIVICPGSELYLDLEEFMNGRNGIKVDIMTSCRLAFLPFIRRPQSPCLEYMRFPGL